MTPAIQTTGERKLVGMRLTMSFADYRMGLLWGAFMPRRREITSSLTNDLISVAVYPGGHFANPDPAREFERWATVEVASFDHIPPGMEAFVLPAGLYAVFDYKGLHTDHSVFRYILETWLPDSGYVLDTRPHVEVLGARYKNNDPASEEALWIPIRPGTQRRQAGLQEPLRSA